MKRGIAQKIKQKIWGANKMKKKSAGTSNYLLSRQLPEPVTRHYVTCDSAGVLMK